MGRIYFGSGIWAPNDEVATAASDMKESAIDEIEGLISVLDDEYCNKHLMYSALELILVRLLPELQEHGVEELWQMRIG